MVSSRSAARARASVSTVPTLADGRCRNGSGRASTGRTAISRPPGVLAQRCLVTAPPASKGPPAGASAALRQHGLARPACSLRGCRPRRGGAGTSPPAHRPWPRGRVRAAGPTRRRRLRISRPLSSRMISLASGLRSISRVAVPPTRLAAKSTARSSATWMDPRFQRPGVAVDVGGVGAWRGSARSPAHRRRSRAALSCSPIRQAATSSIAAVGGA